MFADLLKFDKDITNANILSTLILGKKNIDLPKSGIKENDVMAKKINLAINSNDNNNKSVLILIPDYIKFLLRH